MSTAVLSEIVGLAVRITLPPVGGHSEAALLHLFGNVTGASEAAVRVQLRESSVPSAPSRPVFVEVQHSSGLVCFSADAFVRRTEGGDTEVVLLPTAPLEWVQRRRHVRANAVVRCSFWPCATPSAPVRWEGVTINISAGGVALASRGTSQAGDRLFLEFHGEEALPGEPLVLEVVRVSPSMDDPAMTVVAGRFVELGPTAEAALNRFVETRSV